MKKLSKRVKANTEKIKDQKEFNVTEAVKILQDAEKAKFDETVEAHVRVNIDASKSEQHIRGTVNLPHGSGKSVKVAVFSTDEKKLKEAKTAKAEITGGESLINEIKTKKNIDCDVIVATPDIMPKLAQIARILGPKGLMPNPKNETVTQDVKKVVEELKKGKVNFKNDKTANIHAPIGKLSFKAKDLEENFKALLDEIKKNKPEKTKGKFLKSITLTSTMGLGLRISK
jgi:large subunit ribosomal protein L1